MNSIGLLHYNFKKSALVFIGIGIYCLYAYSIGIKPEFLNVPVFAIASTYMENRFFSMVRTNLIDEIGFCSVIIGVFVMAFSYEKVEKQAYNLLRLKAFLFALKMSLGIWILSYLLFYGYIIFPISLGIFLLFILLYYFTFKYLIHTSN